jgi:hypothetical protein
MPASTASVGRVFTMVIASLPQGEGGCFRDHGRGEIGGLANLQKVSAIRAQARKKKALGSGEFR